MAKKPQGKNELGGISSDELFPDEEIGSNKTGDSLLDMKAENFTVLNFLGNEIERLKKLSDVFHYKMPNKIQFSPSKRLIQETQEEIERYQEVLFEHLALQKDSGHHRGMAIYFNKAFQKNKNK